MICPKICSKSSLKSAKSPLPVDARPSKWSLLFRHHQSTIVVPKKWEILCNAPSTENPWKLLITTNSLELSYPVIYFARIMVKGQQIPWRYIIRRNLSKCQENEKEQAYLTLVRPPLEYVDVAHEIRTFKNR